MVASCSGPIHTQATSLGDHSFLRARLGEPFLPQDVWPDILKHLEHETIGNAMFACRYFRTLTQPAYFHTLSVKHYYSNITVAAGQYPRAPLTHDVQDRVKEKLEFYTQPKIIHYVEVCRITPKVSDELWNYPEDINTAGALVASLAFDFLPKFPNLSELYLEELCLTTNDLHRISNIPNLSSVTLNHCSTDSRTSVSIPIANLTLISCFTKATIEYGTSMLLPSFMQPDALVSLTITGGMISLTLDMIVRMAPLTSLRELSIDYVFAAQPQFLIVLTQHREIQKLILSPLPDKSDTPILSAYTKLPSLALPHLESFTGPTVWARYFTSGRPTKHLTLWDRSTPEILTFELNRIDSDVHLESLSIRATTVTEVLLDKIFDEWTGFGRLRAFSVVYDTMDTKILTDNLPKMHMPKTLEHLSIARSSSNATPMTTPNWTPAPLLSIITSAIYPFTLLSSPQIPTLQEPQQPPVFQESYFKKYLSLRYVEFTNELYSWKFDPFIGVQLKDGRSLADWRRTAGPAELPKET